MNTDYIYVTYQINDLAIFCQWITFSNEHWHIALFILVEEFKNALCSERPGYLCTSQSVNQQHSMSILDSIIWWVHHSQPMSQIQPTTVFVWEVNLKIFFFISKCLEKKLKKNISWHRKIIWCSNFSAHK